MTIIISKDGKVRIERESLINDETKLQELIFNNPETILLDKIKSDIKFFIAAREFKGVDHLGFDNQGKIYIVETKREENTTRREVIAQVLDYGAKLWERYKNDFKQFFPDLQNNPYYNKKHKAELIEKLKEKFEIDNEDELEELADNIESNIKQGNFTYVVVMDQLNDDLKNLILFLQDKYKIEIYAQEMMYHKIDDVEYFAPTIFGSELIKAKGRNQQLGKQWNEQLFFDDARDKVTKEQLDSIIKLYDFLKNPSFDNSFSSGLEAKIRSKLPKLHSSASFLRLKSNGSLKIYFHNIEENNPQIAKELKEKLANFLIISGGVDPNFTIDQWGTHTDDIINILNDLIKRLDVN